MCAIISFLTLGADSMVEVEKKFNWDILNGLSLQKPFFLSGGIGPGDVQELGKIKNDMFFGVDINSRFEISPGIKDFEKVEVFIKKIKYEIQC